MIEYLQEHILLAYRNSIIYIDVLKYCIEDVENILPKHRTSDDQFFHIKVDIEDVSILDLLRKYKMICIQEIGNGMTAFVLEDLKNR